MQKRVLQLEKKKVHFEVGKKTSINPICFLIVQSAL